MPSAPFVPCEVYEPLWQAVAAAGAHRRVRHRVGRKARRRIGVAIAALDAGHRDVRRRGIAGRSRAVVTARAIRVARLVNVSRPRPAGEGRGRAGVAGDAVLTIGRHVAGIRCGSCRAFCALRGVRAVVAGIAAAGAHRRVRHRVGRKARRGIGVAIAALDAGHRDVRRRGMAGRDRAVVTARAIRVGGLMNINGAGPAGEGRGRAGVAGDAVASRGRHVTGI